VKARHRIPPLASPPVGLRPAFLRRRSRVVRMKCQGWWGIRRVVLVVAADLCTPMIILRRSDGHCVGAIVTLHLVSGVRYPSPDWYPAGCILSKSLLLFSSRLSLRSRERSQSSHLRKGTLTGWTTAGPSPCASPLASPSTFLLMTGVSACERIALESLTSSLPRRNHRNAKTHIQGESSSRRVTPGGRSTSRTHKPPSSW
jgi:hypothetical protein